MGRTIDANTAANRVIALALLADSQLARAVHLADDARADARAREDARIRQEEAQRAYREEQARREWSAYDSRHQSAAGLVRSANTSLTSKSVMAGISTAIATVVGAFCSLTVWLIAPTSYLDADYFYGAYGVGATLSGFLWLPVLLGVVTWLVCRRAPVVSLLSVPAIGWIVYESGPASMPPGSLGVIFSDLVESLGEWAVIVGGLGAFASVWLIWQSKVFADEASRAQKKKTGVEANLRQIESNAPSAPRPGVAG